MYHLIKWILALRNLHIYSFYIKYDVTPTAETSDDTAENGERERERAERKRRKKSTIAVTFALQTVQIGSTQLNLIQFCIQICTVQGKTAEISKN